ncbi:MAG: hypothetical protein ACLQHK_06460 [Gallionellaceae bacterium]
MTGRIHRYLFLPLIFVLLFAQQAGGAHALHHALEDLTHKQDEDKHAPHSDGCPKCADYAHLGSALNVGTFDFTPPRVTDETIQHFSIAFRSTHTLPAVARGPPSLLQSFA